MLVLLPIFGWLAITLPPASPPSAQHSYAASPTRFFLKLVEAEVEFMADGSGAITGLVLHQGGSATPGRRL